MHRIRSFASEVTTLILSLTLAVIIWTVAVRADDPIISKSLALDVNQRGLLASEGEVTVEEENIRITIRGPRSVVDPLDARDFDAFVDLSQVSFGQSTAEIGLAYDVENLELVDQQPITTTVTAEAIVDREIPVRVQVRGEAARGHTAEEPVVDPPTILVTGPSTAVNQIQEAQTTMFLDGAREDIVRIRRPIFQNSEARVVGTSNLTLSTEEVTITIPVREVAGVADKAINVDWFGEPATGYRLLNVSVEPASILVKGPPTILESLRALQTEPIDISGLNASFTQRVALQLPEGVELDEVQPIVVEFEIEPILTTSVVRKTPELRALGPGLEATTEPEQVTVFLFGPLPVLDSITEDDVTVTLDLLDLEPGTHNVEPIVGVLASGVEIRSHQPELMAVTITETEEVGTRPLTNTVTPADTDRTAAPTTAALDVRRTILLLPVAWRHRPRFS